MSCARIAAPSVAFRLLAMSNRGVQLYPDLDASYHSMASAVASRGQNVATSACADVRMRSDIQSAPPPDRDHRRRRAFALEDVQDEFVTSDLAQRR